MGWLRFLVKDLAFRIWLVTVLPTGAYFLAGAWLAREAFNRFVSKLMEDPTLSVPDILTRAMNAKHIFVAIGVSLFLATLQSLVFIRIGVGRFRRVNMVAKEMVLGNYSIRYPIAPGLSDLAEEAAATINALADSLEHTDRLRRDLVANMAHEIRTPLTNLQGYLEALRDGVIEPNQQALDSVHEEVLRLVRLVDALHQLARADALRQQPVEVAPANLDALADQLVRVIHPGAEQRGIRLSVDWGARGVLVPVHADSIAQVMRNLLRNAIQYTDQGGTIRMQSRALSGVYTFTCLNTGAGIPQEDLPFIFQRFYRTEKAKQGASGGVGLGLAICKELVEAHGGRIGAQSKNGWTSIWFEIPLEKGVRLPAV